MRIVSVVVKELFIFVLSQLKLVVFNIQHPFDTPYRQRTVRLRYELLRSSATTRTRTRPTTARAKELQFSGIISSRYPERAGRILYYYKQISYSNFRSFNAISAKVDFEEFLVPLLAFSILLSPQHFHLYSKLQPFNKPSRWSRQLEGSPTVSV